MVGNQIILSGLDFKGSAPPLTAKSKMIPQNKDLLRKVSWFQCYSVHLVLNPLSSRQSWDSASSKQSARTQILEADIFPGDGQWCSPQFLCIEGFRLHRKMATQDARSWERTGSCGLHNESVPRLCTPYHPHLLAEWQLLAKTFCPTLHNALPRLKSKAGEFAKKLGEVADAVSECNSTGIVHGFSYE